MANFDPMAQKVARLTRGNERLEQDIATLQREILELQEEHTSMVCSLQEQLAEATRRTAEETDRADAVAVDLMCHALTAEGSAEEIAQLEEELLRARQAAARKAEQSALEVNTLRTKLMQRGQQLQRTRRASSAMDASVQADAQESMDLQDRIHTLSNEVEELEATCFKLHCQAEVWQARRCELTKQHSKAETEWSRREMELRAVVEGAREAALRRREELAEANKLCDLLKTQLSDASSGPAAGASWSSNGKVPRRQMDADPSAAAHLPSLPRPVSGVSGTSPQSVSSRRAELRDRGVQTQYISEQARLQEQIERLTAQLESVAGRSGGSGRAQGASALVAGNGAGLLGSWFSLCLRPRFEQAPSGPEPPTSRSRQPALAI